MVLNHEGLKIQVDRAEVFSNSVTNSPLLQKSWTKWRDSTEDKAQNVELRFFCIFEQNKTACLSIFRNSSLLILEGSPTPKVQIPTDAFFTKASVA
jgi:hypothetical protein